MLEFSWVHPLFIVLSCEISEPLEDIDLTALSGLESMLLKESYSYRNIQFGVPYIAPGAVVNIFGITEVVKAHIALNFTKYLPDYKPVGNDGGGKLLCLHEDGIYAMEAGDLDPDERVYISSSLKKFLETANNLERFLDQY